MRPAYGCTGNQSRWISQNYNYLRNRLITWSASSLKVSLTFPPSLLVIPVSGVGGSGCLRPLIATMASSGFPMSRTFKVGASNTSEKHFTLSCRDAIWRRHTATQSFRELTGTELSFALQLDSFVALLQRPCVFDPILYFLQVLVKCCTNAQSTDLPRDSLPLLSDHPDLILLRYFKPK